MLTALENKFKKYFEVAENVADVKLKQTYDRKFVQIVRDSIKHFKTAECPLFETQLRNLGIDRGTMPAIPKYMPENSRPCFNFTDFEIKKSPKQRVYRKPAFVRGKGAWVPNLKGNKNISSKERICKKVRGILNKLTPTNFAKLSEELISFELWNLANDLQAVVDLIFIKAVNEPLYVALYSKLCAAVFNAEIKVDKGNRCPVFVFSLFEKCQTVFNDFASEAAAAEKPSPLKEDGTSHRKTAIGTVRFIAQLYRYKFLNCQTLNHFCKDLIENCVTKDENNNDATPRPDNINELLIEASVVLIASTATYHKDRSEPKQFEPNEFVKQLAPFKEVVSKRVRFKILDLESSAKKKFPKRKLVGPKTLDEIKSELQEEDAEKLRARRAYGSTQKSERMSGRKKGTKDPVEAKTPKSNPRVKKTSAEIAKEADKWLTARKTVTDGKKKTEAVTVSSNNTPRSDDGSQALTLASDSEDIEKLLSTLVDAAAQKIDSDEFEELLSSLVDVAAQQNDQTEVNPQFSFNHAETDESAESHIAPSTPGATKLPETESSLPKDTVANDGPPCRVNLEGHCVFISVFAVTQLQSEPTGRTNLAEAVSLMNLMCTLLDEMNLDVFPTAFYLLRKVDPANGKPQKLQIFFASPADCEVFLNNAEKLRSNFPDVTVE